MTTCSLFRFFAATENIWLEEIDPLERSLNWKLSDESDVGCSVQVPGRIHELEFRPFWKDVLKANSFIFDSIVNGYNLPLIEWPPKSSAPNNLSARLERNEAFIDEELGKLLNSGAIYEVNHDDPWLILPIQVAEPAGRKKRIIIDAKMQLNPYLCLLYTSPSPRDKRQSRMPSSA